MPGLFSRIRGAASRKVSPSVRFKLLALSFGLLGIFASSGLVLGYLIERNQTEQTALREQYRHYEIIEALQQAIGEYRHFGGQLNSAILVNDTAQKAQFLKQRQDARKTVDAQLVRLGTFDPLSQRIITTALDTVEDYSQRGLALLVAGDQAGAAPLVAEVQRRFGLIESTLTSVSGREHALTEQLFVEARARAGLAKRLAVAIIAVATVGGLILVFVVMRSLVRPLRSTIEAIRQVNAGQLEINLPPATDDEFGEVALALRQFRDGAEKLRRLAYQDTLTSLGNRAALDDQLETALRLQGGTHVALFYFDLDRFRSVNDRLGYRAGDQYLCEAASRLRRFIPAGAELFRYGGDRFVALLLLPAEESVDEDAMRRMAEIILRGLSEPYLLRGQLLHMSVSIGIAHAPEDGHTAESLVSSAEAAGHAAKMSGRNNARFAGGMLSGKLRREQVLAGEIRRGLEQHEFELHYQPIIDVHSRQVVAAEALVRWRHPERGLIGPSAFIVGAEDAGLIDALGERCLFLAHAQLRQWRSRGLNVRVAVNLSGRQIQEAKVLQPLTQLQREDAAATAMMDLELTESVLFEPSEATRRALNEIRQLGYRLCMDDFGTGYSSFSFLRWLPLDKIKIDRQFVESIASSRQSAAIISAMLALAKRLGLEVVAEGVETPQQSELLSAQGCELQQGFLFSAAMAPAEFEQWVAAGRVGVLPRVMGG
jgi:diguanylate cyclase (GGDEF)-like protein